MKYVNISYARKIIESVLPDYDLYMSTDTNAGWPVGEYALVNMYEDAIITRWKGECIDPPVPGQKNFSLVNQAYLAICNQINENWDISYPAEGYCFIRQCIDAGMEEYSNETFWLIKRIASMLNEK